MLISKAIEINDYKLKQDIFQVDPDAKTAYALSNEALKRIELCRAHPFATMHTPLRGETPRQ